MRVARCVMRLCVYLPGGPIKAKGLGASCLNVLAQPSQFTCASAIDSAKELIKSDPEILNIIVALSERDDHFVKRSAFACLGDVGEDPSARQALLRGIGDREIAEDAKQWLLFSVDSSQLIAPLREWF